MIVHVHTVLCKRVLRDSTMKLISLVDCIDGLLFSKFERPAGADGVMLPAGLHIFTRWARGDAGVAEQGFGRFRIIFPDGGVSETESYTIDLTATPTARIDQPLQLHPFTVPGRYWHVVELLVNGTWCEVARVPLDLLLV